LHRFITNPSKVATQVEASLLSALPAALLHYQNQQRKQQAAQ
jgi:hypothetical protein